MPLDVLKLQMKLPKTTISIPKLLKKLEVHVPKVDISVQAISVKGIIKHLERIELTNLLKRLDQFGLPLPMILIPKVNFLENSLKFNNIYIR